MDDRKELVTVSRQELQNARTRGQVIGWIQGGAVVGAIFLGLKLIGWIPLIAIAGVGAFIGYKLMFGGKKKENA